MPAVPPDATAALARTRGVLFDLDGVLTPTLDLHKRAWSTLFTPFLAGRGVEAYSDEDYHLYVDGRPRVEGVRTLLAARGIELADGSAGDASEDTLWGLGNRKNAEFWRALKGDGIAAYPGSLALVHAAIDGGYQVAVVSSSRNAVPVLEAAGMLQLFPVVVDGLVAAERGLPGKPDPATYEYAAEQLGLSSAECVVLEDAIAGVAAGRAGDFGLVVGVDRGTGAQALLDAGADIVVADLAELVPTVRAVRPSPKVTDEQRTE